MIIVWIFIAILALGFISWISEQIQEQVERERSRQRDEIAENVIAEYGLGNEEKHSTEKLIANVKSHFPKRAAKVEEYEIVVPVRLSHIQNQLCPNCDMGRLVKRQGPYGAFLGCSRYPNCKAKKPINWVNDTDKAEVKKAKEAQLNAIAKKFMEDLGEAYN